MSKTNIRPKNKNKKQKIFLKQTKSKKLRYFLYNVKYFFKETIFANIAGFFVKIKNNSFSKKSKKQNIFEKIKNSTKQEKKVNENIFVRIKKFLTPDDEKNWLHEFKKFTFLTVLCVFVLNLIFFTKQFTKDLSRIISTTAFAQEKITDGITDIQDKNIDLASSKFYLALSSFYNLSNELNASTKIGFDLVSGITKISSKDIEKIIGNLENISESSIKIIEVLDKYEEENTLIKLQKTSGNLDIINSSINDIDSIVQNINSSILPIKYQRQINNLKEKVANIKLSSNKIVNGTEFLKKILGEDNKQRVLLAFQNSNEIRATGGFMGSYAVIDFNKGEMVKTEIPSGGTYDVAGTFYDSVEPPMPLKIMTNKWELQDSNWFLDFPTSAKKISYFYESSWGGTTVDEVIAINSNALSKVLELTGDIKLEKYNVAFSKDNAIDELQNIISENRNTDKKPKEVIVDLFNEISDKILNNDVNTLDSVITLNNIINEGDVLAYSNNEEIQNIIYSLGFAGEIKETKEDYLSINYSNVGGSKTSQEIQRSVKQEVKVIPTGEIVVTLKINNSYPEDAKTEERNMDFIRIYVPEGSKLISAAGFSEDVNIKSSIIPNQKQDADLDSINKYQIKDINTNTIIFDDEGKTVFGNFLYLDKGDKKTVTVSYKLPFKLDYEKIKDGKGFNYSCYLQSQYGISKVDYDFIFKVLDTSIFNDKFIFNSDKEIFINK